MSVIDYRLVEKRIQSPRARVAWTNPTSKVSVEVIILSPCQARQRQNKRKDRKLSSSDLRDIGEKERVR